MNRRTQPPLEGPSPSIPSAVRHDRNDALPGGDGLGQPGPAAAPPSGTKTLDWPSEDGLSRNFRRLGRLLASILPHLYRAPGGGLIQVLPGNQVRFIASARELAPLLIDTVRIKMTKGGKPHGELPGTAVLNHMLRSERFLAAFRPVSEVTTTPVYLPDFSLTRPGYNPGGVLYLGPQPDVADGIDTITRFLDVMGWAGNADRTNAVAAALTVPFRMHFYGGKPLVLVTATKSHAGKGTVIDFLRGGVPMADILYENTDWPMARSLQQQLARHPDTGVVNLDNVRMDSAGGRAGVIRTGFLESFVTNAEISLNAPGVAAYRGTNKFVVVINTNEGTLSPDLLNRALPIHLAPRGDVTELLARSPIGNPKLEFLPSHRRRMDAELFGMVRRWVEAGTPPDEAVAWHPMSAWARTIGGILKFNGFRDFLANYSSTRRAADPSREALGVLAAAAPGKALRPGDWAELAVRLGLAGRLINAGERGTEAGRERAMGKLLSPYQGETFGGATETHRFVFRLTKHSRRWGGKYPHVRYTFEVVSEEAVEAEPHQGAGRAGPAFEESRHAEASDPFRGELDQYQPEEIPAPAATAGPVRPQEVPSEAGRPKEESQGPPVTAPGSSPSGEGEESATTTRAVQDHIDPQEDHPAPESPGVESAGRSEGGRS